LSPTHASGTVLSQRALNRALLQRQHLLRRRKSSAAQEIEHLVAMQAQVPNSPYVGLWTRLEGFRPDELAHLIEQRRAVRLGLLRNTIHLVTVRDCLVLRPPFQSLLERAFKTSAFGRNLAGIDMSAVIAQATLLMQEKPRTFSELGKLLQQRWPERDATSLAYAIRYLVPIVQVPPRGIWGKSAQPTWTTAELWLGRPLDPKPSIDKLILRYLAAFGPATVADIATWSGLTALRNTVEQLRPKLRVFRDERGSELFDVPDGPLPDPATPAPPRFLPEYDNLLIGHQDRTRVIDHAYRYVIFTGTLLVDGFVQATWAIKRTGDGATLTIEPLQRLTKTDRSAVAAEGERLLEFAAGAALPREVRISAVASSPPLAPQLRR
jgi:Winged helix DNA-binding domain